MTPYVFPEIHIRNNMQSIYITILHHIGRTVPVKDAKDLAKAGQYTCRELRTLVRKLVAKLDENQWVSDT
jgi:hypothetical protein